MEKKFKVLHVCRMYYPYHGGIERVVQDIAEGLQDKVDMRVLACQEKGKHSEENIHGVPVTRCMSGGIALSLPMSPDFIGRFRKLSRDSDIVHLHLPFPLADLACLMSGYKGKVVLWWHSDVVRQQTLMKFYRPLMEWLLKRADAIAVATRGHIEGSSYLGPYRDKCYVIPFGVEAELLERADEYLLRGKSQEATAVKDDNELRFLFVGRLVYYKGGEVLLRAFAQLGAGRLIIVGQGPLEADLMSMAEELGIAERVVFCGAIPQEELIREWEQCDVFVLPSIAKSEAFGIVQIEAMAYGKPVINTWLNSGVPYVSLNEQTGLTVEPGNVDALTNAMRRLVENPQERMAYGTAAAKRVRDEFSMQHMLDGVYQMYEQVLQD